MKKLLLSLVILLASIAAVQAQVSVGVKAGLNLANLGGDFEDGKMRPSFHLGGYLNIGLTDMLSFQPELLYNSVGAKYEDSETDDGFSYSSEGTYKLSYISLPLNLQYSFGKFNVHAGPQIGILASAKLDWKDSETIGGVTESDSGEDDIKNGLKGIDFGLNAGLGLDLGKLGLTARYTAGLSNIADDDDDIKITTSVIQLSVGYKLFGGND